MKIAWNLAAMLCFTSSLIKILIGEPDSITVLLGCNALILAKLSQNKRGGTV